jgi:hypothetical protein
VGGFVSDEEKSGAAGRDESEAGGRTFTEEQSAIFSNPHDTPTATRPRTPGAESVTPDSAAGARHLGGGSEREADFNEPRPRRP